MIRNRERFGTDAPCRRGPRVSAEQNQVAQLAPPLGYYTNNPPFAQIGWHETQTKTHETRGVLRVFWGEILRHPPAQTERAVRTCGRYTVGTGAPAVSHHYNGRAAPARAKHGPHCRRHEGA